jgi:hypothetical protein
MTLLGILLGRKSAISPGPLWQTFESARSTSTRIPNTQSLVPGAAKTRNQDHSFRIRDVDRQCVLESNLLLILMPTQ